MVWLSGDPAQLRQWNVWMTIESLSNTGYTMKKGSPSPAGIEYGKSWNLTLFSKSSRAKCCWGDIVMLLWLCVPFNQLMCPSVCLVTLGPCEHNRDYTIVCIIIKLSRDVNRDQRIKFTLFIFVPRGQMIGAYCFCPVCLLLTLTFAMTFEP